MNYYPLLALLAFAYFGLVLWLVIKKPARLWEMKKIQGFVKVLGVKGAEIFFIIFGLIMAGLGVWCLTLV